MGSMKKLTMRLMANKRLAFDKAIATARPSGGFLWVVDAENLNKNTLQNHARTQKKVGPKPIVSK